MSKPIAGELLFDLPVFDQIPPGIGQADAVATIKHPSSLNGEGNGAFCHIAEAGGQYPPTRLALRCIVQSLYQETGGPIALVDHHPSTPTDTQTVAEIELAGQLAQELFGGNHVSSSCIGKHWSSCRRRFGLDYAGLSRGQLASRGVAQRLCGEQACDYQSTYADRAN